MFGKAMLLPGVILKSGLCVSVHGKDSNNPLESGWNSSLAPKLKNPLIFCEINNLLYPKINFTKAGF
jgi:hypothetical protein